MPEYWEETNDDSFMDLQCNFPLYCPFHGESTIMKLSDSKIFKFFLDADTTRDESHAIDVVVKCPDCGYQDIYGVAVSDKHYWRVYERIKKYIAELVEEAKLGESDKSPVVEADG